MQPPRSSNSPSCGGESGRVLGTRWAGEGCAMSYRVDGARSRNGSRASLVGGAQTAAKRSHQRRLQLCGATCESFSRCSCGAEELWLGIADPGHLDERSYSPNRQRFGLFEHLFSQFDLPYDQSHNERNKQYDCTNHSSPQSGWLGAPLSEQLNIPYMEEGIRLCDSDHAKLGEQGECVQKATRREIEQHSAEHSSR